jgi:hypothetical protein
MTIIIEIVTALLKLLLPSLIEAAKDEPAEDTTRTRAGDALLRDRLKREGWK